MKTSVVDLYKATCLRKFLEDKESSLDYVREEIQSYEERIVRYRQHIPYLIKEIEELKGAIAEEDKLLKNKEEPKEKKLKSDQVKKDVIDHMTGLPEGESVIVENELHLKYIEQVKAAREAMYNGNLEGAIQADNAAHKLNAESDYYLEPNILYYASSLFEDGKDDFTNHLDDTKSSQGPTWNVSDLCQTPVGITKRMLIPTEENIEKTFAVAKERYENGTLFEPDFKAMISLVRPEKGSDYDVWFMNDIKYELEELEQYHKQIYQRFCIRSVNQTADDRNDEMDPDGGNLEEVEQNALANDDNEDDEEDSEGTDDGVRTDTFSALEFEMDDDAWEAIKIVVREKIEHMKLEHKKELELPHPDSAALARYNHSAHYFFASKEASESMDTLQNSLVKCKLRTRPIISDSYNINKRDHSIPSRKGKTPFLIPTFAMNHFHVDGNMMGMCGYRDGFDEDRNDGYIGYQSVPCPVNLDSADFEKNLRDANGSNSAWWDIGGTEMIHEGREYFNSCLVDAKNNRIWSSSRKGTVYSYAPNEEKRLLTYFSFPEKDIKQNTFYDVFPMTRCDNVIVGTTGSECIFTWNANERHDSDESLPYHKILVDEESNFCAGEVQCWQGSQVVILGREAYTGKSQMERRSLGTVKSVSRTPKLFDIQSEKLIGLFCGVTGTSIDQQLCQNDHLLFCMDNKRAGVGLDTRTFQPTFLLHSDHSRVLGVPTGGGSPVAFTYGREKEDIKCWDLRKPSSHVYTMATGNTTVQNLYWHEPTSSLLASTCSRHSPSRGYRGEYFMYDEEFDSDDNQESFFSKDGWPKGAAYQQFYFGKDEWFREGCTGFSNIVQYAFENGRPMHQS
ncbi:hypothetical protein CTEN210_09927 [Chaetoceros tenuissimus]|uniref:Uncharacterized protein n=1 Tax=Chaetoceros tenuissimus TaxID=426638 RepID=A0AAD3CYF4_9STRA|nr:hypothetical protein CTEN210_09927 [Chaetoceros tenuissimus]